MSESKYRWTEDINGVTTPAFVVSRERLTDNLTILDRVQKESGAKILLAQKAFSFFASYPMLAETLHGTCASSPYEARLGKEEFGGEVHAFAAAYSSDDFEQLCSTCDHILFNSFSQLEQFLPRVEELQGKVSFGIRVNPEHSEGEVELYDPAAPFSRLGVTKANFRPDMLDFIEGIHFHTLCEQDSFALERTLAVFEEKFGEYIPQMKWINFGGGHHITRDDYDVDHLISMIKSFKERYDDIDLYLEPGEAVALDAGVLVASVLDIVENGREIAILDTSATCHMPDVLEMPYRPFVLGSGKENEKNFSYRFAGLTCLAGDVISDYSFDKKLSVGDRVLFTDMAIYSMVKTSTFNGIALPSLYYQKGKSTELIRSFGYEDFRTRLG